MVLVLLLAATPVATAVRSVSCDLDEPDYQNLMHVRLQQCRVDSAGSHTEISVGDQTERWVIDIPRAERRTTTWSWWNGVWHRTEYDDRILWAGTVKTDQLSCRFWGTSKIRYVFSNDTAVCILQ